MKSRETPGGVAEDRRDHPSPPACRRRYRRARAAGARSRPAPRRGGGCPSRRPARRWRATSCAPGRQPARRSRHAGSGSRAGVRTVPRTRLRRRSFSVPAIRVSGARSVRAGRRTRRGRSRPRSPFGAADIGQHGLRRQMIADRREHRPHRRHRRAEHDHDRHRARPRPVGRVAVDDAEFDGLPELISSLRPQPTISPTRCARFSARASGTADEAKRRGWRGAGSGCRGSRAISLTMARIGGVSARCQHLRRARRRAMAFSRPVPSVTRIWKAVCRPVAGSRPSAASAGTARGRCGPWRSTHRKLPVEGSQPRPSAVSPSCHCCRPLRFSATAR